jgi:uncharacterized oxidoreductase
LRRLRHLGGAPTDRAHLLAVGVPDDLAAIIADELVGSNLAGHDSHGVLRVPR